jgi:hypothetical protein
MVAGSEFAIGQNRPVSGRGDFAAALSKAVRIDRFAAEKSPGAVSEAFELSVANIFKRSFQAEPGLGPLYEFLKPAKRQRHAAGPKLPER